jgi:UDP-2-acetamido-3-amino-2,3-dideoxy-glucuronate N-acetyltransferase
MRTNKPIAVVGGGYWGKNLIRNFHELGALRSICDSSPELLDHYGKLYKDVTLTPSFSVVLADADIAGVVIATPAATHYSLVKEALLAGKDVFVEKPMALHRAEGAELVALAGKHQRVLMVGHVLQYHPAVRKLKELVDKGELGKIQYIYSNRLNIGKIRTEENALWSFAPHDVSVILGLLGESPTSVAAHGGNYLHQSLADVTMTTLTFASGVRGHIFVSWLHPVKEQKLVVVGDKKMVVFNDAASTDKLLAYAHQVEWIDRKPVAKKADAQPISIAAEEPLKLECQQFLDCIATRKTPLTDGCEGLAVLSVLEACQKSLDLGGTTVALAKAAPVNNYFVHESSYVDDPAEIGEGTKIWHFSHVLKGSKIGKNCNIGQNVVIGPNVTIGDKVKIQNNVSVYQGVTLEDEVFCGPSMVFTNVINPRSGIIRMHELKDTLVKRGASIGANATIVCGHTVGAYSFIGAGAVVTKDVPDYALMVGTPARVAGWMCKCGIRLDFTGNHAACTACGAKYEKDGQSIRLIT